MAEGFFGWRWLSTESAGVGEKRLQLTGLYIDTDTDRSSVTLKSHKYITDTKSHHVEMITFH